MSEQKIENSMDKEQEELQDDFEFEGDELVEDVEPKQEAEGKADVEIVETKEEAKPVQETVEPQEPAKKEEIDDKPDIPQEEPVTVEEEKPQPAESKPEPVEETTTKAEPVPESAPTPVQQETIKTEPVEEPPKKENKKEPVLQEKNQNTQKKVNTPTNEEYLKRLQKIHEQADSSKKDGKIIINVVHCFNCMAHSYCTHHKEEKYLRFFKLLKEQLEPRNSKFHVTRNYQQKDLTMGAFEVYHNEQLVFSKLDTRKWPNIKNLVTKLENLAQPPEPVQGQGTDVKA